MYNQVVRRPVKLSNVHHAKQAQWELWFQLPPTGKGCVSSTLLALFHTTWKTVLERPPDLPDNTGAPQVEKDAKVSTACENLVHILIADEPEPGMENLHELEVPQEFAAMAEKSS